MKKIDCFGDYCPVPLIKAQRELEALSEGESFMMVTDHSCVIESLEDFFKAREHKYSYETEEVINGVWEITILKDGI